MVVGILRLTLIIPGSRSLKDKRRALHKIVDRARAHFNVSAAEVGDNELWQKAQLGFAVVSNDRMFVNEVLDKVVRDVERMAVAEIVEREVEVESYATMTRATGMPLFEDAKFGGAVEGEGGGGGAGPGEGPGASGPTASRTGAGPAPGSPEADWLVLDDLVDERGGRR